MATIGKIPENYWDLQEAKCPICHRTFNQWFCPSCGLPKDNNLLFRPNIRPEFISFENIQRCSQCGAPNPFGAKYCRCCRADMISHAQDKNRHGWVDLGLSVLWSTDTMKGRFSWMDTEDLSDRGYNGKHWNEIDGKDVASVKWGEKWRMPTKEEFEELLEKCEWKCGYNASLYGTYLEVTGPNGNKIILPTTNHERSLCFFWTSTRHESKEQIAYAFRYNPCQSSERDPELVFMRTPYDRKFASVDRRAIRFPTAIRPVADKTWQGKL